METRDQLPMDTVLDAGDWPLGADALALFKAIYLRFELLAQLREEMGWTATQLIDAAEGCRRAGHIKIVADQGPPLRVWIELTPLGDAAGWLRKHGGKP